MLKEIFLGFTKDKEVVFAEVKHENYFSVSFNLAYPKEIGETEMIEEIENYIENADSEWILDKLMSSDARFSELAEDLYNDPYLEVEDLFDTSLYSEEFEIEGIDNPIYFISSSCGQHDTREDMDRHINKDLYDYLHKMWDEYHLKNDVPEDELSILLNMIDEHNEKIDNEHVIHDWLTEDF